MTEVTDKRDEIIAAAQKRFGQFGFKKTSMLEIAYDLEISKGLLYYYFPDKEHLYVAVVEKEFEEFKQNMEEQLSSIDDPFEILRTYVKLRLIHFKSFLNFGRFRMEEMHKFHKVMLKTKDIFHDYERDMIIKVFQKGIKQKLIIDENPEETAELLFDLLRGIRVTTIKDKQLYYLDNNEFNNLAKKNEIFIEIFISGLKYNAQKPKQK